MAKLLSAEWMRLRKSKLFWGILLGILLFTVMFSLNECRVMLDDPIMENRYDNFYFTNIPFLSGFIAAFSALFIGTEYANGTLRNKVTIGYTRTTIYLSELIVSVAAAGAMLTVMLVGGLVGLFYLGIGDWGIEAYICNIVLCYLSLVAMCAILTMFEMCIAGRASSAVFCIALVMLLLVSASVIYNGLQEPKMYTGLECTVNGIQRLEPSPNPRYIDGVQRKIYAVLMDILPTGQQIQIANFGAEHPIRMALCSVGMTILTTLGGCWTFRKKDLK